jgi:outer membrane autotransporter protein
VFLTLFQSSSAFANGAQTGNQYAVGAVLDKVNASASGDFNTVLNALSGLDTQQGPAALNTISGQPWANFGTFNTQTASAVISAVGAQMSALHGGLAGGTHVALAAPSSDETCDFACDVAQPSRFGAWISGVGGLGSALGNSNAGTLTYNFGGTAIGADYRLRPDLLVGLGAGYITGTQWTDGSQGRGTTDAFSSSLYASYTPGRLYIDGLAGYGHATNRLTRTIAISGLQPRTATGTTGANQFFGQIETGYRVDLPVPATASITPFFRLEGATTTQNGFTESGAQSLDLTVAQQTVNSLRTTVGVDLAAEIRKVDVDIRLGWQHENADTARPMTASFAGAPGQAFTVFGATPQRDSAVLGLGASADIDDATELYARYDGEVGGGTDNHAFTAGLRLTW